MFEVRQTETYKKWFKTLRDRRARARIDIRIKRISLGNLGDVKSVGKGVFELRIDYGPGYRVYFVEKNRIRIILLAGGKKSTQKQDIKKHKNWPDRWRNRNEKRKHYFMGSCRTF